MIGVLDSGVGGLAALREMRQLALLEDFLYLADTARHPFGILHRAELEQVGRECARTLQAMGARGVVVACNTLSATALEAIRSAVSIPVAGVLEAAGSLAARSDAPVVVLATLAIAVSGAHMRAIRRRRAGAEVTVLPCSDLVDLIENGRPL
jgi:glutamate racemase